MRLHGIQHGGGQKMHTNMMDRMMTTAATTMPITAPPAIGGNERLELRDGGTRFVYNIIVLI